MPPEQIRGYLRARPFISFGLHLSDGRVFEIRHPDLVVVGRTTLIVGIPEPGEDPYMERSETIALIHIVSIEPFPQPTSAA